MKESDLATNPLLPSQRADPSVTQRAWNASHPCLTGLSWGSDELCTKKHHSEIGVPSRRVWYLECFQSLTDDARMSIRVICKALMVNELGRVVQNWNPPTTAGKAQLCCRTATSLQAQHPVVFELLQNQSFIWEHVVLLSVCSRWHQQSEGRDDHIQRSLPPLSATQISVYNTFRVKRRTNIDPIIVQGRKPLMPLPPPLSGKDRETGNNFTSSKNQTIQSHSQLPWLKRIL